MPEISDLKNPATYETNPALFLDQAILLARASELAYETDPGYVQSVLNVRNVSLFPTEDDPTATTKGFSVHQDTVSVLAFQGSFSTGDWVSNARFATDPFLFDEWGHVHRGFYSALLDCLTKVIPQFIESSGDSTIWLTGHSRGGAIAILAAAYIKSKFHRKVNVMTYGQPMVGTSKFCRTYNNDLGGSTFRFIAQGDPVPSLPGFSYEHCGKPKKIKRDAVLEGFGVRAPSSLTIDDEEADTLEEKQAEELMDSLASGAEPSQQRGVNEGFFGGSNGRFEAHKMVSYIRGLEAIKTAQRV